MINGELVVDNFAGGGRVAIRQKRNTEQPLQNLRQNGLRATDKNG